jgi:hypothetical protein
MVWIRQFDTEIHRPRGHVQDIADVRHFAVEYFIQIGVEAQLDVAISIGRSELRMNEISLSGMFANTQIFERSA